MSFEKQVELLRQRVGNDETKANLAKTQVQTEHESFLEKVGNVLAETANLPTNDQLLRRWCRSVLFPKKPTVA